MNREELKKIIIEEVLRALGEQPPVPARADESPDDTPVTSDERPRSSGLAATGGSGLVVFSGSCVPAPALVEEIAVARGPGLILDALFSLTFKQRCADHFSSLAPLFGSILDPSDENALAERIAGARWLLAPDVSANTLNKLAQGIEDSGPTRALGEAMRTGRVCVFVETADLPRAERLARTELLRRLGRRGAHLATLSDFIEVLGHALAPPELATFDPPAPKPPVRRSIITGEDVYEASRAGGADLVVDDDAIVTSLAYEDAVRRGIKIRRRGDAESGS